MERALVIAAGIGGLVAGAFLMFCAVVGVAILVFSLERVVP
jgi:hypothetical protein